MRSIRLVLAIPLTIALATPALAQSIDAPAPALARSAPPVAPAPFLGPRPADAGVLVEAERAFAADVGAWGIRDGFLKHLAADAIVLEPDPEEAVPAYEARERRPALLEWAPVHAEITTAGDLGWTTGPWTYRVEQVGDVVAGGHYVTIWRRGEDGIRRVELDAGVAHAPPSLVADTRDTRTLSRGPDGVRDRGENWTSLAGAERAFVAAAADDLAGAYRGVAASDLRTYRMGVEPGVGRAAAVDAAVAFGPLEWTFIGARVSADGSLGYTYGVARVDGGPEAGYLRIWRRLPDEGWALALDQSTAVTAPAR